MSQAFSTTKEHKVQSISSTLINITCDKCGNHTFETVVLIKRISAIMSPTGQEALVPIQVFSCNACGWVNKEFLPSKERNEQEESTPTISV